MEKQTREILMDAAGVKIIHLSCYDRSLADEIIEFYGAEYEKTSETVQDRGPFDFIAPMSRDQIVQDFVYEVTNQLKRAWCRTLTDDQARTLLEVMSINHHKMIVHGCVEIMAMDIKLFRE